jgi:hypothetical protein
MSANRVKNYIAFAAGAFLASCSLFVDIEPRVSTDGGIVADGGATVDANTQDSPSIYPSCSGVDATACYDFNTYTEGVPAYFIPDERCTLSHFYSTGDASIALGVTGEGKAYRDSVLSQTFSVVTSISASVVLTVSVGRTDPIVLFALKNWILAGSVPIDGPRFELDVKANAVRAVGRLPADPVDVEVATPYTTVDVSFPHRYELIYDGVAKTIALRIDQNMPVQVSIPPSKPFTLTRVKIALGRYYTEQVTGSDELTYDDLIVRVR